MGVWSSSQNNIIHVDKDGYVQMHQPNGMVIH